MRRDQRACSRALEEGLSFETGPHLRVSQDLNAELLAEQVFEESGGRTGVLQKPP